LFGQIIHKGFCFWVFHKFSHSCVPVIFLWNGDDGCGAYTSTQSDVSRRDLCFQIPPSLSASILREPNLTPAAQDQKYLLESPSLCHNPA
jgi:hypothetical protein